MVCGSNGTYVYMDMEALFLIHWFSKESNYLLIKSYWGVSFDSLIGLICFCQMLIW